MKTTLSLRAGALLAVAQLFALSLFAVEKAVPLSASARLPLKEVTVFKDGYAYVAQEGEAPVDDHGNVVLDYLPTPVIGTFWPYATDVRARLTGVVAGRKRVRVERTALNLREQLEANVGAEVIVNEGGTNRYEAKIAGLPQRSAEELAAASPPYSEEQLPQPGELILLQTAEGLKALPIGRIQDITFKSPHQAAAANEEFRDLLTLRLDWGQAKPAASAQVGFFYLQKGVRWIPSYKVEMNGHGQASLKLEGTLINELADLDDATVNLVIGVPTFDFKDTIDPIALQQNLAQLSRYFQADAAPGSPFANNFSNAIMAQSARGTEFRAASAQGEGGSLGPDIGDSGKNEDLYVFAVPHVKLRKGERLVLTIAEFTLPYEDVYTLDLPLTPPTEMRGNLNTEQQREMARLFNAPKVIHKIRLTNNSKFPLTTAPALLLQGSRVIAQGMMTYAAVGASVDLPVTTAVDIQARKSDAETKRTPGALHENGADYARLDLKGKVTLTNHRAQPVALEVTRSILGTVENAGQDGQVRKLDLIGDDESGSGNAQPIWWNWYGWPNGWSAFNGISRVTWKLTLDPGQQTDLDCQWYYYWR